MNSKPAFRWSLLAFTVVSLVSVVPLLRADPGTRAQRLALLDSLIEKTAARDAFSPEKNARLKFDGRADMLALRDEFAAADTDDKLYFAIVKASAARRDRHLSVDPVPGGLRPWFVGADGEPAAPTSAPVRLMSDFDTFDVFVADLAHDPSTQGITIGDTVTSIDGVPTATAVERARPYRAPLHRIWFPLAYATTPGFAHVRSARYPVCGEDSSRTEAIR